MLVLTLALVGCSQRNTSAQPVNSVQPFGSVQPVSSVLSTVLVERSFVFPVLEYGKSETKAEIFAIQPFPLTIRLPERWETVIPEQYTGSRIVFDNAPIKLSRDGVELATIDYNRFDLRGNSSSENYYRAVDNQHNQLMLSAMSS